MASRFSASWLKAVALLVVLQATFPSTIANKVRHLSTAEFETLGESQVKTVVVVHFDRPETRKAHPKFMKEYAAASDVLESFNIELAKVNCRTDAVVHCSSVSPLYVLLYRDGAEELKVPFDTLFNQDSIVANLLQISLEQEIRYIYDTSVYSELVSEVRGKKDLVVCYVNAYGTKAHRSFVEAVFVYEEEFAFAMTTDQKTATTLGLPEDQDFAISLFQCKNHHTENQECPTINYMGQAKAVPLARFLQSQNLPKTVSLGNDGTEYENASISVNKIYVFTDEVEKLDVAELEQFSEEMQGAIGIIIVNVLQHKSILPRFGFSEKTSFPTAAFVPAVNKDKEEGFVEQYPEGVSPFSLEDLKQFVLPLLTDPDQEYQRLAFSSALHGLWFPEYADSMLSPLENNYVLSPSFTVVAFCRRSFEPCGTFHHVYRRLVRTLSRAGYTFHNIGLFYVDTRNLHDNKHHDPQTEPIIRIFSRSMKYRAFVGEVTYERLLEFVINRTQFKDVTPLPLSASDLIPIASSKDEDSIHDGDDGDDGVYEPEPPPLEEIEDDEVAAGVLVQEFQPAPAHIVPSLTDKTFDSTKHAHDLLVVHFLQPWDVRCKAFTQLYSAAAVILGSADVGEFSVKLAQVNCFDWTDVCKDKNITRYPTIKMYRDSKELNYQGPLDSEHLVKAVLLLHSPSPVQLKSQEEAKMFLDGKFPKTAVKATDVGVLGMFSRAAGNEYESFVSVAEALEGKFMLGYVCGDIAQKLAKDFGLGLPAALISKRTDALRPLVVFRKGFTAENLMEFIQLSSLPVFGELTVVNLPLYHRHHKPLVIVFRQSEPDTTISPAVAQIAKEGRVASVFFCSMTVEEGNVNAEILQSYVGKGEVPTLVMVDHSKSAVYQFQEEVSKSAVLSWISRCLSDEEKPTSVLKEGRWKPLLEGYDFLKKIDEEEAAKKTKGGMDEDGFIDTGDSEENEEESEETEEHEQHEQHEQYEQHEQHEQHESKAKRGRLGKPNSLGQSHDEL